MYDIKFFKNSGELKRKITGNLLTQKDADDISAELDVMRDKVPFIYNIETTNYCNLNCSFCNRDEVVKKLKHMSLVEWELVLEKLKNQPIKEAKLMGLGEPFLHPKFSTICKMFNLQYLRELFISLTK